MADTWTRTELVELYPLGTVGQQIDNDIVAYTEDEWNAWIDGQVGTSKEPPLP